MASKTGDHKQHAGRKLVDIAQKARGRTPFKYELEVIPFFAGELPSGLEKVSFAWERGAKLFQTDAEAVNPHTRAVFWKQYLKQTATIYKENGRLLPKEYSFKIQHVRGSDSTAVRKTVGKMKVDMSQFCSEDTAPIPQEVFLQLKPAGKLKVSIKCTWLKDAKIDMDALTEASFTTHKSNDGLEKAAEEDEQDLSGFDHFSEGGHQPHAAHSQERSTGAGTGSPRGAAGSGDGSTISSNSAAARIAAKYGHGDGSSQTSGSPRIGAMGGSPLKSNIPGAIAAFSAGLSPAELEEQEKARQAAFKQAEMDKMRRDVEDQLRLEMNDALASHNKSTWRDMLCCCFPRKARHTRLTTELAVRDADGNTLLASQGEYL